MANNQSNADKLKAEKLKTDKLAAEKVIEEKKIADEIALEEGEKLKAKEGTVKYFFKSEDQIGFKKRNFYFPSTNKRYLIIAGAEIDEKTYNLFSKHAQKAFCED